MVEQLTLDREALKALASDTRLDILKKLDERQKTVTELARELDLNKATVFEHCERLMSADLIQKIEDDRKWVYYQLSWKGRRILHPERMTIALLLSSSLAAVVSAAAAFVVFWRTRVPGGAGGGADEDVAIQAPAGAEESDMARSFAEGAAPTLQAFLGDASVLGWAIFLASAAVLLAFAALYVRAQAKGTNAL